jgi:hypothetical protein
MFEHQLQGDIFEEKIFSGAENGCESLLLLFRHGGKMASSVARRGAEANAKTKS